ncbi:MAG TPA: hypothetical protein VGH28_27925 [Polyangiaceae bacterium]
MSALKLAAIAIGALAMVGCKKKVTPTECEAIVDRYAELVVKDKMPDASAETIASERAREKSEAHGDDVFKNCASEIEPVDYDCAMKSTTPEALEKCLE